MTSPATDPGPPPPAPPTTPQPSVPRPSRTDRFFSWTSGLGLVRGDGWLGGVAAGLATRMRVDPLIVRGILVVTGLFGFPVLFLYAIAWAVLPDRDGRMPLQEAIRGSFSSAQVGIGACAALGLLPGPLGLVLGFPSPWSLFVRPGAFSALAALVFVGASVVTVALILLIVRAARRAPVPSGAAAPDPRTASSGSAAQTPGSPSAPTGSGPVRADRQGTDAAGFAASAPALSPSGPLGETAPLETEEAYAAWREQHAAWKVQDDAWRRQQQDADRAARDEARRERQERATAFAAEAAERRRLRRATRPRTPFAYVATVVGLAVIAGTIAALRQDGPLGTARGLFVAALVLALAVTVAGALRRRSGFLAFVTVAALGAAAIAVAVPAAQTLHVGAFALSNVDPREGTSAGSPYVQPWGDLAISIADTGRPGELYVQKQNALPDSSDWTKVWYADGVSLDVELTTREASVESWAIAPGAKEFLRLEDVRGITVTHLPDGRIRYAGILGDDAARTHQKLVIAQDRGMVVFQRAGSETQTSEVF